jgi:hypothetical protein
MLTGVSVQRLDESPVGVEDARYATIAVELRGGASGGAAIRIQPGDAILLTRRVLERALSEPPPAPDADLAMNTIGELLNIALGEYFMEQPAATPVQIRAPRLNPADAPPDGAVHVALRADAALLHLYVYTKI